MGHGESLLPDHEGGIGEHIGDTLAIGGRGQHDLESVYQQLGVPFVLGLSEESVDLVCFDAVSPVVIDTLDV